MKVLVLGGSGMLGHKLVQNWINRFDLWTTLRGNFESVERFGIFDREKTVCGVSAESFDSVVRAFAVAQPAVVVNCIGVVKQVETVNDPIQTLTINAVFPHRVAALCRAVGARFINLSTDCVFSGTMGNYNETDVPDAADLYGRSKNLGEVTGENCLTLRTSIIGRELDSAHSLIEWFLSNRNGSVKGYKNAIYSGFTTLQMGDILGDLIENKKDMRGMWHVASQPISKYELLKLIESSFHANIAIEPEESFFCDRSLNGQKFAAAAQFKAPDWQSMIARIASDPTPYHKWK